MTGRTIPNIQAKISQMEQIAQDKLVPMPRRKEAARLARLAKAIKAKRGA
jgi:hypothetical protein